MSQKVHRQTMRPPGRELTWESFPQGNSRHPCPACDKSPKDRALSVTITGRNGIAFCFRCKFCESSGGPIRSGDSAAFALRETKHTKLSDYWRAIWRECVPISGVAREYLISRNCFIPPRDGDLRWHPEMKHGSGFVGPALVGLISDAITREPLSLHRTWIRRNGQKSIEGAKRYIYGHRKARGVVRLWPDESVHAGLGIGEGIESVLSLAHAFQPVWACLDSGNLNAFPVLPSIAALSIGADNDDAGLRAAENCAHRWLEAGREVRIILPAKVGSDLNDLAGAP